MYGTCKTPRFGRKDEYGKVYLESCLMLCDQSRDSDLATYGGCEQVDEALRHPLLTYSD